MFRVRCLVATATRSSVHAFVIFAAIAVSAAAKTPPQIATDRGSFRGRIIDIDTGQPITQEITIVVTKEGAPDSTRRVIDVKGEFVVSDLSPGRYRLQFREMGYSFENPRYVQVTGLSAMTRVDIYLRLLAGDIHGVVTDGDGEPVQGSRVMLVSTKYLAGQALYTAGGSEQTTNDRGYFSFSTRVQSGHPYFVLALPPEATRPSLSGTASLEAAWYPSRPGLSQPFVLRSGERKRIDLVMEKRQTRCVDGRLMKDGQPSALNFEIAIPEVAGYLGTTGGTRGVIFRGESDPSGRFQTCGLWPGEFLLAAGMNKPPAEKPTTQFLFSAESYGRATVSIADSDVHNVMLNTQSRLTLAAEIHSDGSQAPAQTYRLSFTPLSRVAFESQPISSQLLNVVVPSQFSVPLLPSTDYLIALETPGRPSDVYVKEAMCDGSVRRDSLKLGDTDCGLHITVGTDTGKLAATIVDKDGKSDLNSAVCVFPTSAVTREEIGSTGTCSSADPGETSVSITLRPDRYFAVVMPPEAVDWVEYILTNRSLGTPIDVKARSTSQVTLKSSNGR